MTDTKVGFGQILHTYIQHTYTIVSYTILLLFSFQMHNKHIDDTHLKLNKKEIRSGRWGPL